MQEDEHGFPKAPFQARAHPPRTGAAHFVGVSVLARHVRTCAAVHPRLEQDPVLGTHATHATHATNATLPGGRAHGVLRPGE